MNISIVTSYYNRKELLYRTLLSINESKQKNIEFIVVDDGSDENERIEDFMNEFKFLKVVRIEKKDKWYVNPCIPFNIAINKSVGDIIVIQNPECVHVGDVLTEIVKYLTNENYITLSTYAINENSLENLNNAQKTNTLIEYLNNKPQQPSGGSPIEGWYNHSKYRPVNYHFCSAITRENMKILNGFDNRYAYGISFDDNEFIERVKRLGLIFKIIDHVSVIHQWHPTNFYNRIDFNILHKKNKDIFNNITMKENLITVNI